MDPNTVKLNPLQKIKPLLRAINREIPWQVILFTIISMYIAVISTASLPVILQTPLLDFIVRRIICGVVLGGSTWAVCGLTYILIEDKVIPMIGKIRGHYEEESLEVKKKILDNVIDDEILKK